MKQTTLRILPSSSFNTNIGPTKFTYWRWEHAILLDTVDQFEYPSLFITITANAWEMPQLFWVNSRSLFTSAVMQLPYTMHLQKASTCSTENRPWFHGGYDHQGVPKNLTLYDLAVGWQKVAFEVKANTNTKNLNFGCCLMPIFSKFPPNVSKFQNIGITPTHVKSRSTSKFLSAFNTFWGSKYCSL